MEFAAKGLEGASTRGIASAAGTAMSSITYHYGGKEGLYLAAAEHIAEQMVDHMVAAIDRESLPVDLTPTDARKLIHEILARFIETIAGEKSATWALFIVREQMQPTEAFERIYSGVMGAMFEALVSLVRTATGRDDADTAEVAVLTLTGQVLMLRSSRATAMKLLHRTNVDDAVVALVGARIAANTDAILDQLIAERQELS